MKLENLFLLVLLFSFFKPLSAEDVNQSVLGEQVEDTLGKMKNSGTSPYVIQDKDNGEAAAYKGRGDSDQSFIFTKENAEDLSQEKNSSEHDTFGYTPPGSLGANENYLEINKTEVVKGFRKRASGGINIAFIKDDFTYASDNDIIQRTIGEGYKHVKGGAIYLRNDRYFYRSAFTNTFWSVGAGLGYNSGRGLFVAGNRSETTFKLWEVPLDLGVGLEVPLYHWFKIAGVIGPSAMGLLQNRNDLEVGEKGKNKMQVSYGQFANVQFRINLSGMSTEMAYDLFADSKITNLSLNLEARYQNYQNFQDNIQVSGTSVGLGFTFEYL